MSAYSSARVFFYSFAWASAVVLLGLTAFRVHWTRHNLHDHDPIIVELLVTACLTILTAPFSTFQALSSSANAVTSLSAELLWTSVTWVMYIVGGAITTNKWPSKHICEVSPPIVANIATGIDPNAKQCHTLLTIVAFSWITFGALTLAGVAGLMQWAAERAAPRSTFSSKGEKVQPPVTV